MEGVHLPDDPTRVHGDRLRRRACLADDPVRQACPVRGSKKAQLVIYREPDELTRPVRRGERKSSFKAQPIRPIRSASTDETLLDSLRQLRKQIAEREHTPAYIIFSDDSLEDMVEKKPVTLDQFSDIRGVGQIKLDRYGKVFVALIRFVLKLPK